MIPDRRSGSCRGERAPRNLNATVTDVAKAARQTLEDDRLSATLTAEVNKRLSRQDDQLDILEARIRQLGWENRRGGGRPWGLILVGGYLLYRFNSTVQERIEGLFGQADPGTKGILNRASVAVKDAAQAGVYGDCPQQRRQDGWGRTEAVR